MEVKLTSIFLPVLLILVLPTLVKVLNWVWFRPKKLEKLLREQGLRGNPYRFLVGDMNDMIQASKDEKTKVIKLDDNNLLSHILPFYHSIICKYGQNSFIWFGPTPRLNISDPQLLKEILAKPHVFHKTRPDPAEIIAGGLAFLDGDRWVKRRKIITPAFHLDKLKGMTPVISLSCKIMIEKWEGEKNREIDVWPYIEDLIGDVISRTAFGISSEAGRRVYSLQQEQVKLVLDVLQFFFIPGWRFVPTKANRRMRAISKEIGCLLRGIIDSRETAMGRGEDIGEDFLNTLLETNFKEIHDHGNERTAGLSVGDVIDECRLFYFAGTETTSVLLVYAIVMLSKHQEWQARARQEVLQAFGKKDPTFDGLSRLKIVTMILYEVLRLYPPAPVTIRTPTKAVKLGNITVPAGVDLMLLIGELHHNPKIWGDDVSQFKPERFSEGISSATETPFSFIPFISGPRACVGQNFAMIMAKMTLAMILQRFLFELSSSYRHAPFPILTLHPQYGATLLLQKL